MQGHIFEEIRGTGAYWVPGGLEVTDYIMENSFCVGVHSGMADEMAGVIREAVREGLGKRKDCDGK